MNQITGVRIVVGSEAEAEQIHRTLQDSGGTAETTKQVDEAAYGILPVFVWVVVTSVFAVASLTEIIRRWISVNGCSAIVSVNKDGQVELDKDCDVKGLVILKDKDGKLTYAERKVLDLEDVLKAIAEKGIGAAVDVLKKAGGKEGDPSKDDGSKDTKTAAD